MDIRGVIGLGAQAVGCATATTAATASNATINNSHIVIQKNLLTIPPWLHHLPQALFKIIVSNQVLE